MWVCAIVFMHMDLYFIFWIETMNYPMCMTHQVEVRVVARLFSVSPGGPGGEEPRKDSSIHTRGRHQHHNTYHHQHQHDAHSWQHL